MSVGDGLIRMTIGDIRNEDVFIVRSECAEELIAKDGYVGDRVDYLKKQLGSLEMVTHRPNISDVSLCLSLAHTYTHTQTPTHYPAH